MPRIAVVTDSTAGMPQELAQKHDIHIVPTYITFGRESYRDGVDLGPAQFYRKLEAAPTLPTTSQPPIADFVELYSSLSRDADAIVSVHLATELSATLGSARSARQMMQEEAASEGKTCLPIHVIDSRSVSMGLGFVTLAAARAAIAGESLPAVIQAAEAVIPRVNILFTVETLKYMHKGGRIGGAAALLGSVLSLRPILAIEDGRVEVLEKVRTYRRAVDQLPEIMAHRLEPGQRPHVAVLHAEAPEVARDVAERIAARFDCAELHVTDLCAVVGTHVGPGMLGLVFHTDA